MNRIYRVLKALRHGFLDSVTEFFRMIGRKSVRLGGPIGFFSVLPPPRDASLVSPPQVNRPAPSDSLRVKCGLNQHGRDPWPIFWKHFSNARLVGKSLVVLNDKKELLVEAVFGLEYAKEDPSYHYLCLPPATRLSGAWTSIVSRWCPAGAQNYYHWLMDGLPRLALLDRFPPDTGIIVGAPLKPFQRESLEILNLLDRCRPTPETHLQVENYYFSSPPAMTGCDNPHAIHFLRDRFLEAGSSQPLAFEKIYVARRGTSRKVLQENEMIDFLQSEGWTILQAENYSFKEQIALFSNARAICSVHGAGLTNLLWCRKGCKVLELCAANFLNGCYEGLAAYLDLDYRFMLFEADPKSQIKLDLKRFGAAIRAMDN